MIKNIEHIITKFWAGETSLEEEQQLQSYLNSENVDLAHRELVPLFEFYNQGKEATYKGELTFSSMQQKAKSKADRLLEKYFQGETTLAEEEQLKFYFSGDDIDSKHSEYASLFQFFSEQENVKSRKALDMSFLDKKEETIIREFTPATKELKSKPKTRRLFPRIAVAAASFLVLTMFSLNYFDQTSGTNQDLAEAEAQEALETTMEALAYLGHNYDKGADPMKHMKQLEKTNIFKFN